MNTSQLKVEFIVSNILNDEGIALVEITELRTVEDTFLRTIQTWHLSHYQNYRKTVFFLIRQRNNNIIVMPMFKRSKKSIFI